MLFWIVTCIACLIVVGVLLGRKDEAYLHKRRLRRIQKRLEEKQKDKDKAEDQSATMNEQGADE